MIYLIGTGPMSQDYAKVLIALGKEFIVVGRGEASANRFEEVVGIKPFVGGVDIFLSVRTMHEEDFVIIATGTEALMPTLKIVVASGAGKVLVEKPAAISIEELLENENYLLRYGNNVFVAYNRRFYSSVSETIKLIEIDGGLENMHFEFTEWAHKIEPLDKAPGVKENWFFANSTHVIDLAFFIAGNPIDLKSFSKSGELKWHSKTKFSGAGITDKGVLFSYFSNWESAGRWSLEFLTNKRRIFLRPLESISIQSKGSIEIKEHIFDGEIDRLFKPGLFNQVKAFLENKVDSRFCSLTDQINKTKEIYNEILS